MIARGVRTPADFTGIRSVVRFCWEIDDPDSLGVDRVALRTTTNDWDTVYTLTGSMAGVFSCTDEALYVSVARVDSTNIESLFSIEKIILISATEEANEEAAEKTDPVVPESPQPIRRIDLDQFSGERSPIPAGHDPGHRYGRESDPGIAGRTKTGHE